MLTRALPIVVMAVLVGSAFGALLGWNLTLERVPVAVMEAIEAKMIGPDRQWNKCVHERQYGPLPRVARSNPDSMVTRVAYDLSEGSLRLRGETWADYWSLSVYQQNTDNVFVINAQQIQGRTFDFTLSPSQDSPVRSPSQRIISPTTKGILLIRRFVVSEDDVPAVHANQDSMTCELV
ncbi:MAG: DUF1254 domain-containing protein [Parvularculaceae bacterium]|nr:DUF1254 domain-containing protein [Parvularculaceae bacterium]